jgi:hypothetical protein
MGRVVHDPRCREPINEHIGTEACLSYEEPEEDVVAVIPVALYKRGPQGNMIIDYNGDYRLRHGETPKGSIGSPGIADRRDNRDPQAVYDEMHPYGHPHHHTLTTTELPKHSQNGNSCVNLGFDKPDTL